jgi:hypothetical protein
MNRDQIAASWSDELAIKLGDRYGVPEAEAREEVDTWFVWLKSRQTLGYGSVAVTDR